MSSEKFERFVCFVYLFTIKGEYILGRQLVVPNVSLVGYISDDASVTM